MHCMITDDRSAHPPGSINQKHPYRTDEVRIDASTQQRKLISLPYLCVYFRML